LVGDADGVGAESTSYVDADADASTAGWGRSHGLLGRVLDWPTSNEKRRSFEGTLSACRHL
jgi:hypothetical protein